MNRERLIFDWVLINKLAIGTKPNDFADIIFLEEKGIKSIFNLCEEEEAPFIEPERLKCFRYPLPDHKHDQVISTQQIINAINHLEKLLRDGPVFVHCYASVERSPLICMAWLVKKLNLSLIVALDYMKQIHKETNPLTQQIDKLKFL